MSVDERIEELEARIKALKEFDIRLLTIIGQVLRSQNTMVDTQAQTTSNMNSVLESIKVLTAAVKELGQ